MAQTIIIYASLLKEKVIFAQKLCGRKNTESFLPNVSSTNNQLYKKYSFVQTV